MTNRGIDGAKFVLPFAMDISTRRSTMINRDRAVIERNAVATLLYFDIFDHPLTLEETFAFLPENSITVADLDAAIAGSTAIDRHDHARVPMLLLRGRPAGMIDERMSKERRAARLWRVAGVAAHVMACFPFVRGLFVSGSLSKNSADRGADIDWFIVTEPGRLWICKTLLTLFRRVFLLNQRKFWCTNYYVSADALEIPDRNVFIATEIATARPVLDAPLAARFFAANSWITQFLPNVRPGATDKIIHAPIAARIRRIGEFMFRGALGDRLEQWCFRLHDRYEHRKHRNVSPADYNLMFRSQPHECKIHEGNFQRRVIEAYTHRLRQFGLERNTGEI